MFTGKMEDQLDMFVRNASIEEFSRILFCEGVET